MASCRATVELCRGIAQSRHPVQGLCHASPQALRTLRMYEVPLCNNTYPSHCSVLYEHSSLCRHELGFHLAIYEWRYSCRVAEAGVQVRTSTFSLALLFWKNDARMAITPLAVAVAVAMAVDI